MSKLQKINIYVGTVGSAYIDKETALKNKEAAQKNVADVEAIITKANNIKGNLENASARAAGAKERANSVKARLSAEIINHANNAVIYNQLVALMESLETNDNDGVYKNGGNIKTADSNISNAQSQLDEINAVIEAAEILLEDNKKLLKIRENELLDAENEFAQYIPDAEINIDDLSNDSEDYLNERIDEIDSNITIIEDVTDHIDASTNEYNDEIDAIINGEHTDEPTDDQGNALYWYAGQIMPEQYYTSDSENFIVTEDSVNTWHKLTLIKDTNNGQLINKLLVGVNSISSATKWYVLVPESMELTPVKSDMTTVDPRFTFIDNITEVNGENYKLYEVDNSIPVTEGAIGNRLNIIMITGVEIPDEQVEDTDNYWFIGTEIPQPPYNPQDGIAVDNPSQSEYGLGWRLISGNLNDYNEDNPYWPTGKGIDVAEVFEDVDFYIIVPQNTKFKDAIDTIDIGSPCDSLQINGHQCSVYKLRGLDFSYALYIDANAQPQPQPTGDVEPTGETGEPEPQPTGDTQPAEPTEYYWYIGLQNPSNDVIAENLAEDGDSLGWHYIGTQLGTYSAATPLNTNNGFVLDENFDDVDYFLALPGSLKAYDGLGGAIPYTNLGTTTISGIEYTIYQGIGAEFNYKIY
jgi:hypothetical protein